MKIVRRETQRAGVDIVVAFIDTEGIDLGIDAVTVELEAEPEISLEGRYRATRTSDDDTIDLDAEDDPVVELPPVITDDGVLNLNNVYFCITTFKKLTKYPAEVWDALFLPANRFLAGLSESDARAFCLFYIDARKTIDADFITATIDEVARNLGNDFFDLAVELDLANKLLHFVKFNSGIPIPDLSYAGTRAGRDTAELTFGLEEYYCVVAISILCKLLCPIWGDIINRTVGDIDNTMKETFCLNIIDPMLEVGVFRTVRHKLYNYISNIVNTAMRASYTNASFTATIGGFSLDRFYHIVFATIIVKRYVNVDLYTAVATHGRDGNIMVWTSTCAKQSFNSLLGTLNKRCRIMPRTDISDGPDTSDEERNISVLEYGSRVTAVTADVPVLIRFGAKMAVRSLCQEYDISDVDFRLTVAYYRENPIQVSVFNRTLVGILLGNRIGGAQGLKYLTLIDYIDLVVIMQIHLVMQGYEPLVHLLTATTPDTMKPRPSQLDGLITTNYRVSGKFRNCEDAFPYPIDNVGIVLILRHIHDYILRYPHYANTAPAICAMMDRETVQKDSVVDYGETVIQDFCAVILDILKKEEHTAEV